jgi:hypothetical protein
MSCAFGSITGLGEQEPELTSPQGIPCEYGGPEVNGFGAIFHICNMMLLGWYGIHLTPSKSK